MHQSAGVTDNRQKIVVPKRKAKAGNITWQKKVPKRENTYTDAPIEGNYIVKVS